MPEFDGQQQLDLGVVAAFTVNGLWVPYCGWELMINFRREFARWGGKPAEFYSELSTDEMLSVLEAELSLTLLSKPS